MEQILLFPPALPSRGAFRPGEIARQARPWIGCFDAVYPYWQVRFSTSMRELYVKEVRAKHPTWPDRKVAAEALEKAAPYGDPDVVRYYCSAVPYGAFPEEIWWFGEEDLVPTGLSWRVPPWEEIAEWCVRNRKTSCYVAGLNAPHKSLGGPRSFYPSYPEEDELVAILNTRSPSWTQVTRETFDLLFSIAAPAMSRTRGEFQLDLFA